MRLSDAVQELSQMGGKSDQGDDDRTEVESKYGKVTRSNDQLLGNNRQLLEMLGNKNSLKVEKVKLQA